MLFNLKTLEHGYLRVGVVAYDQEKQDQIIDSFKGLMFQKVMKVASFQEALELIKSSELDWVFASYCDKNDMSIIHFLQESYGTSRFHPFIVSALLTTKELHHLPDAFAEGLFSWHPDKGIPEYTRQSIWKLRRHASTVAGLEIMVPYLFYRNYLKQKSMWQELISICEKMTHYYQYEDVIRLHLVEAYYCAGQDQNAKDLLNKIEHYEPALSSQVEEVRKKILDKTDISEEKSLATQYNMDHALVVGSMNQHYRDTNQILTKFGLSVTEVDNINDAWSYVKKHKVNILILDWDLDDSKASIFLQRCRISLEEDFPIIVYAETMTIEDSQIVSQFNVSLVISENSPKTLKAIALSWVITQFQEPTEAIGIERKIYERLAKLDIPRANRYFDKYIKVSSRNPAREKYLKAQIELAQGNYLDSKYLLLEAHSESIDKSERIETLMARCLIELGDFQAALAITKKILKQCPTNIYIACLHSLALMRSGEPGQALQAARSIIKLDPDLQWAKDISFMAQIASDDNENQFMPNTREVVMLGSCNLAIIYFQQHMLKLGIRTLQKITELAEAGSFVHLLASSNLAIAHQHSDNLALAQRYYEQCSKANDIPKLIENHLCSISDSIQRNDKSSIPNYLQIKTKDSLFSTSTQSNEIINEHSANDKYTSSVFLKGLIGKEGNTQKKAS